MPTAQFTLKVTADTERGLADLGLLDGAGSQRAFHQVDFPTISISQRHALFDLRTFLHLYRRGREQATVAEVGVLIAEKILGEEIFRILWQPQNQRTLCIQLPGAAEEQNPLAEQLARVPWEIARPAPKEKTLAERNLLVRVVHDQVRPVSEPIGPNDEGCLRILCVFAEARGSTPLSARRERRELEQLFEREIYPTRKIEVDFLTHGVTRERLHEQIQGRNGYHVVHWSGHGHLNLLELAKPDGTADRMSGEELLDLFTGAGGLIPQMVFLSACHSGEILSIETWQGFIAAARGEEAGARTVAIEEAQGEKKVEIVQQPGYTGTAHALLQGGVPSVVAMRCAVGDDYARALAIELYRALFAHPQPKKLSAALTLARNELLRQQAASSRFPAADPATPILYGAEDPGLTWQKGRSPALDTRDRRLHRIPELTIAEHAGFVGRTWELAGLGASFIGSAGSLSARPVALITGLGGMGKTALAAEALDLWAQRFDWVLLYQAKPNALAFDTTLHDVHMKLYAELGRYHEHVKMHPADAIYRDADAEFTGPQRIERLTRNLLRALSDEPIFLVLDNFESNLKPSREPGATAEPLWTCKDPAWDRCLFVLATELSGSPSRALITCRRIPAALAGEAAAGCYRVPLGPLPPGEAALYLRDHEGLSALAFSPDEAERRLARRLLLASRFHPLLMDRLARLATGGQALRPQLLAALDAIEKNHDGTTLPGLFSAKPGDEKELAYLEDALAASIDELIRGTSPEARRLLWMVAVANESVTLGLVKLSWNGPDLAPHLAHLVAVGLVTEERTGQDDENPDLTCHELVRERIRGWMTDPEHSADSGELSENMIRIAYAERLEAVFWALRSEDLVTAFEAGRRALVYCVQAEAWERLGNFASGVVTSSDDPVLLGSLIPHLQAAAAAAPEGRSRWRCLACLADAFCLGGRPDTSLPLYELAATQARAFSEAAGDDSPQAWSDLAWISFNWVNALRSVGDLDSARQRLLDSAEAQRKAGRPEIHTLTSELEALRIDVIQGGAAEALPQIESRLGRLEGWWRQHRAGDPISEAPDPGFLARALIGALDIARDTHFSQRDWEPALRRIDDILEVKRHLKRSEEDIAGDRMNRANALTRLGRRVEAKAELESCLAIFRNDPTQSARALGSLASLFDNHGDLASAIDLDRRALTLFEQLPNPSDRATSHDNLAISTENRGDPADREEAPRHRLAALIYRLVAGLEQDLQISMHNYVVNFHRAHEAETEPAVPLVAELLDDPAFRPLAAWLRGVEVEELQAEVDQVLEAVRQAVPGR